jgi:hypothetical protein
LVDFRYIRKDNVFGDVVAMSNGSLVVTGMVSDIYHNRADMIFGNVMMTPQRHRQTTLDCRYLTILSDNLKKRMFLQNFFPLTLFWEFVMFFQLSTSFHYYIAKQFHYGLKNNTSRSNNDVYDFKDFLT